MTKNAKSRVLAVLAGLLLAAAVSPPSGGGVAWARQPSLGGLDDLAVKDNLDPADAQRVKAYAAQHAASLDGEPEKIRDGRAALVSPLTRAQRVSVRFRLALSEELLPKLAAMVRRADERELAVVNALRVAGELATSNSLALVRDALKDARPPVRYAAVYALGRTLDAVGRHPPAVQPAEVFGAIEALGRLAAEDTDLHVADGAVVALTMTLSARGEAGTMPAKDLKSRAMTALAAAARAHAAKLAPGESQRLAVLVRCLSAARQALSIFSSAGEVELSAPAVKELAAIAGDAASALARLSGSGDTGLSASLLNQSAMLVETVFGLACGAANAQVGQLTLQQAVRAADAAAIKREATRIVDKLTAAPFSLPRDRFDLPR